MMWSVYRWETYFLDIKEVDRRHWACTATFFPGVHLYSSENEKKKVIFSCGAPFRAPEKRPLFNNLPALKRRRRSGPLILRTYTSRTRQAMPAMTYLLIVQLFFFWELLIVQLEWSCLSCAPGPAHWTTSEAGRSVRISTPVIKKTPVAIRS